MQIGSLAPVEKLPWRRAWQHSSILAWRTPWAEDPGALWVAKNQTWLKRLHGQGCVLTLFPTICRRDHVIYCSNWNNFKSEYKSLKELYHYKVLKYYLLVERLALLYSVQFSSVAQSCPTLFDPMNCSTPGLPSDV